jgi:formylmethanofuran dehydrogenase subunit E
MEGSTFVCSRCGAIKDTDECHVVDEKEVCLDCLDNDERGEDNE